MAEPMAIRMAATIYRLMPQILSSSYWLMCCYQSIQAILANKICQSMLSSQQLYMNYRQQSSDISSSQEQEEQELTDKLFKNYRQIKNSIKRQQYDKSSSKKSMGSVQRAIEIEQQKNLQTRITLTEKQLAKARQNNILLLKKLGEAEENAEYLKFQMDKYKREKEEEITSYCNFIESLKQDLMAARQSKIDAVRTSESKDLMAMRNTIDSREKQVSRLNLKIKSLEFSLQEKDGMLKSNALKIQQLGMKIQQLETKEQQVIFEQQSHGSQILELQQARSAVQRLLNILKTTEEYKTFYNHSENYEEVFFLQTVAKKLKNGTMSISPERKSVCKCKQLKIDQRMIWAPTNCYKALLMIKQKYEVLNQACIQQILFELNQLWLAKEDQIASKIREQYKGQLQRMKKKTFERYDELVARKQIERLKKELQQNRFTKRNPQEEIALLKNIGEYEDELRIKQREIKLLSERIKLMEAENVNYDRVLYLQGALWLIDKVLDEVNYYQEEISLTESRLHDKYEGDEHALELQRMLNSCFESFREITNGLVQKLLLMKDTTLKKVGVQKKDNAYYQE